MRKDASFSRESFMFMAEMLSEKDPTVSAMAGTSFETMECMRIIN
jgi:hypothetical protein